MFLYIQILLLYKETNKQENLIMKSESRIWYRKPAVNFDNALPLGNGRIGAMDYGVAVDEVISLNEDSIWSGGH